MALLATEGPCPGEEAGPCAPRDRLTGARGFVNLALEAVFDEVDQLYAGEAWFPVRADDTHAEPPNALVTTGLGPTLEPNPDSTCGDYTEDEGWVSWARPTSIDRQMLWQNANGPCATERSHYCASLDYDAPLEPLTGSGRLAFLSATGWTPGGGLESADAHCQREACEAGLTGSEDCDESLGEARTFLALLEGEGLEAGSRFDARGPDYFRADGLLFLPASSLERTLEDFAPRTGLATRVDGTRETADVRAWSGARGHHCGDWSSTEGEGRQGTYTQVASFFAYNRSRPCSEAGRLYCLEK